MVIFRSYQTSGLLVDHVKYFWLFKKLQNHLFGSS